MKRYYCNDCHEIFYTNPNMVVGALCIRDNKILLAKETSNQERVFGPCQQVF